MDNVLAAGICLFSGLIIVFSCGVGLYKVTGLRNSMNIKKRIILYTLLTFMSLSTTRMIIDPSLVALENFLK